MADHGADEDLKSSSEERKKQMLKAKIVKSAKKKIEESEKVRAFATSCAASWTALGQQCTCATGTQTFCTSRPRSCSWHVQRCLGEPGPRAAARFFALVGTLERGVQA